MSFDSHLIHTCTIETPGENNVNAYNNLKKEYEAPINDVKCRLVEKQEQVWSDEVQASVVKTVYQLLMPAETNVQERSKISKIILEDGTILSTTFTVKELLTRRRRSAHHQTAILERIS